MNEFKMPFANSCSGCGKQIEQGEPVFAEHRDQVVSGGGMCTECARPSRAKQDSLATLEDLAKIQSAPGTYDYEPYQLGMANGLILALATIKGEEPKFLDAPAQWLIDRRGEIQPVEAETEGTAEGEQAGGFEYPEGSQALSPVEEPEAEAPKAPKKAPAKKGGRK